MRSFAPCWNADKMEVELADVLQEHHHAGEASCFFMWFGADESVTRGYRDTCPSERVAQ